MRSNPSLLDPLVAVDFVENHPLMSLVLLGGIAWWVLRPAQVQAVAKTNQWPVPPNPPSWLNQLFGQTPAAPPAGPPKSPAAQGASQVMTPAGSR